MKLARVFKNVIFYEMKRNLPGGARRFSSGFSWVGIKDNTVNRLRISIGFIVIDR